MVLPFRRKGSDEDDDDIVDQDIEDIMNEAEGLGERIAGRGNDDLLLPHEVRYRRWWLVAMMASLGHHHQQNTVRAKACSVMEGLPNFGGC